MDIYESLENLNVSEECFNDIMGIVEELLSEGRKPVEKRFLHAGGGPILGDKEYVVHTKHDDGTMKTRLYSGSAKEARDTVHRFEKYSPENAHTVLVKDNPQRTAEEVRKILDNGKRKVHVGTIIKNKKGEVKATGSDSNK